ncbi:unnamed protein product [Pieris macdunnoughi]|uniref:Uncharacterized protein n=1 Tax=Pieris macdunnoughi TaxID=345717 RepID=A0A821SAD4_9NEOP|nr:unnamed protein product [Pieris macdunnoughi]
MGILKQLYIKNQFAACSEDFIKMEEVVTDIEGDIGKLQRQKENREKLNFSPDTEQVLLKNDSAKKANKLDKENCF